MKGVGVTVDYKSKMAVNNKLKAIRSEVDKCRWMELPVNHIERAASAGYEQRGAVSANAVTSRLGHYSAAAPAHSA